MKNRGAGSAYSTTPIFSMSLISDSILSIAPKSILQVCLMELLLAERNGMSTFVIWYSSTKSPRNGKSFGMILPFSFGTSSDTLLLTLK